MPNYCFNQFSAYSSNPEDIIALQKATTSIDSDNAETLVIDFEKLLPLPPEEEENRYERRLKNRGTKWNTFNGSASQPNPNQLTATFDTAWAPPTKRFKTLAQTFPHVSLTLEYEEPGMQFEGTLESNGDGTITDYQRDYVSTCEACEIKKQDAVFREDTDEYLCDQCFTSSLSTTHAN